MSKAGENPTERELMVRAVGYLATREHSRQELRRKLLRLALGPPARSGESLPGSEAPIDDGAAAAIVDAILDRLQAQDLLSNQRFVESRLRSRAPRFGNLRIRHELAQHGIALPMSDEAHLQNSELERALFVWNRKYARQPASSAQTPKQARFLAARGFSGEVIRQVLRQAHAAQLEVTRPADPITQPDVRRQRASVRSGDRADPEHSP